MPEQTSNPRTQLGSGQTAYDVLRLRPGAGVDEIEEAYDSLFDEYEPAAQAGDDHAIAMLESLNESRETLLDPARRSALDAGLTGSKRAAGSAKAMQQAPVAKTQAGAPRVNASATAGMVQGNAEVIKARRRSKPRPRAIEPRRTSAVMQYALVGVLGLALLVAIGFLVMRGMSPSGPADNRGSVVATVNGQPIYSQDWEERVAIDKQTALSDPMMSPLLNNFQGITGTRALDILRYDSLDKLVNLEILNQEAQKENRYPTEDMQKQLIADAKSKEVQGDFNTFLRQHNISEGQYNRRVVQNAVYVAMADAHMPTTGTDDERTQGFINYVCSLRPKYDVRLLVDFTVKDNQPCTSGLPSDYPLPGLGQNNNQQQVPEPEATQPGPVVPKATPGK